MMTKIPTTIITMAAMAIKVTAEDVMMIAMIAVTTEINKCILVSTRLILCDQFLIILKFNR